MTKDELEYRLNEIDNKVRLLQKEREQLLQEYNRQNPPTLGIHVKEEIGAEDKFGGV